jgi:hypothetical protein
MLYFKYTELTDKSALMKDGRVNAEKLKGKYKVHIKKDIPSPMKI